jgi:AcrR family transcriptional regulator
VIEEAEAVVDEVGVSGLTLATIAARLGVQIPSLYKHVAGMAALQSEIAIRAKNELALVLARASVGRAGDDAILAISQAYRSWAKQHPGRYATTQRATESGSESNMEATRAVLRVVTDAFVAYDLDGDDLIDAIRALRATLHGFIDLELAGGFGLPVDVDRSFDRAVRGLTVALEHWQATSSGQSVDRA